MANLIINPGAWIRIPAEHHPDRICLSYRGSEFTYREINRRANRLAWALDGLGLKRGSRVATLQYNCNQSFELFVGMWKAGVVMVPLNTRDSSREHLAILRDSQAEALVFGGEFTGQVSEIREALPQVSRFIRHGQGPGPVGGWLEYEALLELASDQEPDLELEEDAVYKIHYTSGTTGTPRGVMMTYRNRMSQVANVFMNADWLITHQDVIIHVAPLTHAAGYYSTPFYLKGARHVVLDKFETTLLLKTIERERATTVLLVPTMIVMLLEDPDLEKYDLSSLRRIFYGTAPMPIDKLKRGLEIFGPIFRQNYGLTESVQPLAALTAQDHQESLQGEVARLQSTGHRALGTEIRIVDQEDHDLPPGEVGEILLRGSHVSPGYLNLEKETAATYRDGWLHSGDLGRFDEDGFLYIVDRKKDMIISGGFNIYSREVEMHLDSHPAILESAVIGLPDEKWGEACTACVVLKEKATPPSAQEMIAHCLREGLPKYKVPKLFLFMDTLPKNENKKIMKKQLKEMALAGMADGGLEKAG